MSNNGSQHLSALTRDEITAPHVNLVPLDLPGDLYKYVADHVWGHLEEELKKIDNVTRRNVEALVDELIELKEEVSKAPRNSEERKAIVEMLASFKNANAKELELAPLVFWNRVTDNKHRRKIVKRNVMTLPYGGTPYGLGQQQIDDARKHGIDLLLFMEHRWGSYMGRAVYDDCKISLKRPMQLLSIFEKAGKEAEQDGRFLSWVLPITNFPVVQNYVEGTVKKVHVAYGPALSKSASTGYGDNDLQLHITHIEQLKPSKNKQSQGAAPNAIHSLDACHLMLISERCNFPVTTIHDSFGCLLADMPVLYRIARETFVELYKENPLPQLLDCVGGDISGVEFGNLDIQLVLDSEYCFA